MTILPANTDKSGTPDPTNGAASANLGEVAGLNVRARLSIDDCYIVVVDDKKQLGQMNAEALSITGGVTAFVHAESQALAELTREVVAKFADKEALGKRLVLLTDRDLEQGRVGEDLIKSVMGAMPGQDVRGVIISGLVSEAKLSGDHNHLDTLPHVRAAIGKPFKFPALISVIEGVINTSPPDSQSP